MKINLVSVSIVVGGALLAGWFASSSKGPTKTKLSAEVLPLLTDPEAFISALRKVIINEVAYFSVSLERVERLELAKIIQKILDETELITKLLSDRQRETVALTLAQEVQIRQQKLTKLIK